MHFVQRTNKNQIHLSIKQNPVFLGS